MDSCAHHTHQLSPISTVIVYGQNDWFHNVPLWLIRQILLSWAQICQNLSCRIGSRGPELWLLRVQKKTESLVFSASESLLPIGMVLIASFPVCSTPLSITKEVLPWVTPGHMLGHTVGHTLSHILGHDSLCLLWQVIWLVIIGLTVWCIAGRSEEFLSGASVRQATLLFQGSYLLSGCHTVMYVWCCR